jgi:hypothetical protein
MDAPHKLLLSIGAISCLAGLHGIVSSPAAALEALNKQSSVECAACIAENSAVAERSDSDVESVWYGYTPPKNPPPEGTQGTGTR